MKIKGMVVAVCVAGLLGFTVAGPLSAQTVDIHPGFNDLSSLGEVAAGDIVLLENPNLEGDDSTFTGPRYDPSNWSDVLRFGNDPTQVPPLGTTATAAWLISDTEPLQLAGGPFPANFPPEGGGFPSDFQITGPGLTIFLIEVQTGTGDDNIDFTVYNSGNVIYNIYSGCGTCENGTQGVPEPSTIVLFIAGLGGLGLAIRRQALIPS